MHPINVTQLETHAELMGDDSGSNFTEHIFGDGQRAKVELNPEPSISPMVSSNSRSLYLWHLLESQRP